MNQDKVADKFDKDLNEIDFEEEEDIIQQQPAPKTQEELKQIQEQQRTEQQLALFNKLCEDFLDLSDIRSHLGKLEDG